jgi:hypothetical protein
MPTLNWIGRKTVENHHIRVPLHLLAVRRASMTGKDRLAHIQERIIAFRSERDWAQFPGRATRNA